MLKVDTSNKQETLIYNNKQKLLSNQNNTYFNQEELWTPYQTHHHQWQGGTKETKAQTWQICIYERERV